MEHLHNLVFLFLLAYLTKLVLNRLCTLITEKFVALWSLLNIFLVINTKGFLALICIVACGSTIIIGYLISPPLPLNLLAAVAQSRRARNADDTFSQSLWHNTSDK